jgi:hypothetical protein
MYHDWQAERSLKMVSPLYELHFVMVVLWYLFDLLPLKQPQWDDYLSARSNPWLQRKDIWHRLPRCIMIGKQSGRWRASAHGMTCILSWWSCVICSTCRHWNNHSQIITCLLEATHGFKEKTFDVSYSDVSWLASREVVDEHRPMVVESVRSCPD